MPAAHDGMWLAASVDMPYATRPTNRRNCRMNIVDTAVRVFRHTSRQVRDSDGHTHPGDPHEARQALLTITTDDGSEGHCLGPVEVVRPHLINGFVRHVLIGQDPFDRERIWQDL